MEKGEDYIQLNGRPFVLFKALLAMATERGLEGIASELIQAPSSENQQTAIVRADVTLRGENGAPRIFSCLGDASPETTKIKGAYVRMAETRAIGRALRMGLNIGETAFEEIGPDAEEPAPSSSPTPQPLGNGRPEAGGGRCSREGCGNTLTAGQTQISMKKYNQPLCPACQRFLIAAKGQN